jgi:maltooligosyltrehalose trehalohydrolase
MTTAAAMEQGRRRSWRRRLPVGAELQPNGGVHFRVWAPRRRSVDVVCEGGLAAAGGRSLFTTLEAEGNGYFAGFVTEAGRDTLYHYRLDGGELFPDPASRFQPEGPHGPSQVVDPDAFRWTDAGWKGCPLKGQVLYEMHVGTFTPGGTYEAAARELPALADVGVTVLEVMPVAEFVGGFGWGYDGVDLFAPYHHYGTPDDFRRFVDRAHALGLGVLLDVVYNHQGPDGCYLKVFAEEYFTGKYANDWGEAINFDGPGAGPVREFYLANAGYWIDEFHLDGLRLDATQNIYDESPEHILAALARRVRSAAGGRATLLVNENEPQQVQLVKPAEQSGYGLDALWNDDFHHSARVALTGKNEAYYTDYLGRPQEFIATAKFGYLYQGQWYKWQKKRRGTPTFGVPPAAFVNFLENHDQLANSGAGRRLHTLASPGRLRAMTALLLLGPGTPMLFQGQEYAAPQPFLYFADHKPELARRVAKGRAEFLAQFPSLACPVMQERLADPGERATFERCKLDPSQRVRHAEAYQLHRDLLRLRRQDPVFAAQQPGGVDGAVLGGSAFILRFFGQGGDDRLLLVNLGSDLAFDPAPEPLLAPPADRLWTGLWSSEDPQYGGQCARPMKGEENWVIPGESATVLGPRELTAEEGRRRQEQEGPRRK